MKESIHKIVAEEISGCCTPIDANQNLAEGFEVWADRIKSVAHPVRLGILSLLRDNPGGVCVCDIEARFSLSQPTISHHLRLLRNANLVITRQEGSWIHYQLNGPELNKLTQFFATLTT